MLHSGGRVSTLLAVLRHGETEWSRDKRIQGRTDIGLSDAGSAFLSSRALPNEYAGMQVCTSPLLRCRQSADRLRLIDVRVEPRLIEMAWGDWEGQQLAGLRASLGQAMADNEARGWDLMPPKGESPRLVWQRVLPWLTDVAAKERPALAVTHRGVIRVLFAMATGWDMLGKPPARLDWTALHVFSLDGQGGIAVRQLNVALASAIPGRENV